MTAYNFPHATTISQDVLAKKAARRKVIKRAHQLEQESYKALMRKRRQLRSTYEAYLPDFNVGAR